MIISKYKAMFNTVLLVIIFLVAPGYCSRIETIQGTDVIRVISNNIDSCIVEISNEEYDKALEQLEYATESWRNFQLHHDRTFSGEIERLDKLPEFFSDISRALEKTHGYIVTKSFDEALTSLNILNELLFELIEEIDIPVLLDFTGPKCKACKTMKNRLPNIAADYKGRVRIVFVDANQEKDLVKKYKIMLIPTLVFIARNGEEIDRHIGDMEERTIKENLDGLLD